MTLNVNKITFDACFYSQYFALHTMQKYKEMIHTRWKTWEQDSNTFKTKDKHELCGLKWCAEYLKDKAS